MAFRHVVSGQDAKIRLKDLLFDASELQYPENPPVSVFQFDGGEDHKISEKLKVISEEFMTLYIRVGKQGGKSYLVGFRPEKTVEWTGGVIKAAGVVGIQVELHHHLDLVVKESAVLWQSN